LVESRDRARRQRRGEGSGREDEEDPMKTRHTNQLRKICTHGRRRWAKCGCPWHFSFKWKGVHHRFSLDKHLGRHVESKSEAADEAATIRIAIKAGRFGQTAPTRATLTLAQLLDTFARERHRTRANDRSLVTVITSAVLTLPTGEARRFGDWLVADLTTGALEQFRTVRTQRTPQPTAHGVRMVGGPVGVNRALSFLRRVCNWAILQGYMETSPFKRGTVTAVTLPREAKRTRRLREGEAEALLAACGPHLRAVVECALATGMRRGEILGLRWRDVQGRELRLPAASTKTRTGRTIPISTRLAAILECRKLDPAGAPLPPEAFVFGDSLGHQVKDVGRAWESAVLRAHGRTPGYTRTANLDAASRAALAAIDLHFHDLRREAGSRWLEGGVALHTIRDWLGHVSIAQTSTYLAGTMTSQHNAMAAFEARTACNELATPDRTGHHRRPQTAAEPDETPNKTAVGRGRAIM
jgi:integrase